MSEKPEIDRDILDEAQSRGCDYLMKYACAPGVFAAVMDTLGYEDDPVVNEVWKASVGFIGGTGNMAIGTCGAMAGAAMAIGYSFGLKKENLEEMFKVNEIIAEVGRKMQEKYGHIQCQEVQFHLMGKSYRLTNPEAMQEFMNISSEDPACKELNGDLARWTVKKILEHNPQFSKRK